MLYLVLTNGLVDSLNPCAIGILVFYLGLLLSLQSKRKLLLIFGLFYIISIYTTYLFIGLGLFKTFHFFGIHNFFGWLAAILIIFLGLHSLKEYFFPRIQIPIISPFLSRCRIIRWNTNISIASAVILGFLVGICEFPCSGGIYLATVALLSAKETFFKGLSYLLLYNLMFVLPLVIIFVGVGNPTFFNWFRGAQTKYGFLVKLLMGLSMTISGILLIIWLIN
ncbi:MAG: Cytochrome c bioproteinis protein transmembrane region [Candidatus Berkelbacteria bacterium Licking1014_2]|uniref:Cytochrome c bioproteinis protein transmembrane region n=1 Tax=Candidatus Berkelbacteria bacterium Licking1014_2 TaxID=2017146 RepID=A0A554LX76_9BACT|nr:MAG: Cytochrome c bioproteinis protein transmembrane region [Candidatus Berkelbacteria bacterium Licking1014_2]